MPIKNFSILEELFPMPNAMQPMFHMRCRRPVALPV